MTEKAFEKYKTSDVEKLWRIEYFWFYEL